MWFGCNVVWIWLSWYWLELEMVKVMYILHRHQNNIKYGIWMRCMMDVLRSKDGRDNV